MDSTHRNVVFSRAPEGYFLTPGRVAQFEEAKKKHKIMLNHDRSDEASKDQKYGTIGVVARDGLGNLAAATSTKTSAWGASAIARLSVRESTQTMKPVPCQLLARVKTSCAR